MLSVETIATFTVASILLCLAPGPDNIFVLMQSAVHGKGAGLLVTIGLCTGLIGHTLMVALGVAAIFQTSSVAFTVLKLVGTGYLLYLAWKAFTASSQTLDKPSRLKSVELYRRGAIMNITNPKVSLFFLAFLPQFVSAERGPVTLQIILLGLIFILCTAVVFGSVALLAGTLGQWLNQSPRAQSIMNRIAALVFVGIAVRIATSMR